MGDPAELDGRELVERIRAGDRAACAALVRRYRPGVIAMVRRACGPGAAVDDVSREVLSLANSKVVAGIGWGRGPAKRADSSAPASPTEVGTDE